MPPKVRPCRQLKEEFGHTLTYMDTRFLILDLGIELIEEPKPAEKKEEEKPAPEPTGTVVVTMDTLTLPGALVSGKVTFSDGETAICPTLRATARARRTSWNSRSSSAACCRRAVSNRRLPESWTIPATASSRFPRP